ncbi:MAG: MFS transporter, partial [Deltaproteobacteria bacterium]|nr:MFS transporter [Deltaproteobacteria bacterium]
GSVERKQYGIASGAVGTMRLLGMMFSMGVATVLFALFIGRVQITGEHHPALMQSVQTAFGIFGLLCFGGVFASLVRGRVHSG